MMTTLVIGRKVLVGASLALAVLWVGAAPGEQAKDPVAKGKAVAGEGKGPHVKAFKLSHADPEEVRQTLTSVWPQLMTARRIRANAAAGRPAELQLAVSSRLHTLFVRGTEQQLEAVQELVKVLDTAPGESVPESKDLAVVRLRHVKVPEVLQVLNGLGLQGQIIPLPKLNALILPREEEEAKEVRVVLESLDAPEKPDGKTARNVAQPKK
jgi:type II secretory pathway component GspD/PulD (secretin)